MKVSTNQFAKKNFNDSSNTFTAAGINQSANRLTKRVLRKADVAWEGANTSASAFGATSEFGGLDSVFGSDSLGGFAHYKLREKYSINHT